MKLLFQDKYSKGVLILISALFFLKYLNLIFSENNFELESLTPNQFYFFPYLNDFIWMALNYLPRNILLLISIVVFPMLAIILLISIYNRYINLRYSIIFSLLSVSFLHEYNLRIFIFDIVTFNLNQLNNNYYLVMSYLPLPGISVVCFLFLFNYLISSRKNSNYFNSVKTILCAFYFYVSAIDSFFIIIILMSSYCLDAYKKRNAKLLLLQIFLLLIIITPGLILYNKGVATSTQTINFYNLIVYNILPIIFTLIFFIVKRIDPYEVWYKFKFVYLLLFSELLITILIFLGIIHLNTEIMGRQILHFFAHLLYYTPLIYYGIQKQSNFHFGTESNRKAKTASELIYAILAKNEKTLQSFISIILILYHIPWNMFF